MAKTDIHGWPLPELTATANVPQDMKNLADQIDRQVPFVCTADSRPAPIAGLIIFETDTLRTYIGQGSRFIILGQDWRSYTPSFGGWINLGTSPTRQGAYSISAGSMVNVRANLKSGAGTNMGAGRLAFSLPIAAAGYPQQSGTFTLLATGPTGWIRNGIVVAGGGGTTADLYIGQGATAVASPGAAGVPWQNGSEIHINFSYRGDI